jgi:hypothetical protein
MLFVSYEEGSETKAKWQNPSFNVGKADGMWREFSTRNRCESCSLFEIRTEPKQALTPSHLPYQSECGDQPRHLRHCVIVH